MDLGRIPLLRPSGAFSVFIPLVRDLTKYSKKALEWLLKEVEKVFPKKRINIGEAIHTQTFIGLPFTKGCSGFFYMVQCFLLQVYSASIMSVLYKEFMNGLNRKVFGITVADLIFVDL
jgi:hypothetical protein